MKVGRLRTMTPSRVTMRNPKRIFNECFHFIKSLVPGTSSSSLFWSPASPCPSPPPHSASVRQFGPVLFTLTTTVALPSPFRQFTTGSLNVAACLEVFRYVALRHAPVRRCIVDRVFVGHNHHHSIITVSMATRVVGRLFD